MKKRYLLIAILTITVVNAELLKIGGMTVFDSASAEHASELKVYLDRGVNVNIKDADGDSLLSYACAGNKFDNVKLLVERGANVKAINTSGETILESCIILPSFAKKRENIIEYLKSKGAK